MMGYKLQVSSLLLLLVGFPWPGSNESMIKPAVAAGGVSYSAGYTAYVTFRAKDNGRSITRVYGTVTVWNPNVIRSEDYSLGKVSLVQVDTKTNKTIASIEAGYIVFPERYGDNKTRFYTRWQKSDANGKKTAGCFDVDCKGFVLSQNGGRYIGRRLAVSQTARGGQPIARGIPIQIYEERSLLGTGSRWVVISEQTRVGYWPSSLFKGDRPFNAIEFGGEVYDSTGNKNPSSEMGNGLYPVTEANYKAAYIYDVSMTSSLWVYSAGALVGRTILLNNNPSCYKASIANRDSRLTSEATFLYGGPGCR